jgi:cytochrome c oxidase subunit IV
VAGTTALILTGGLALIVGSYFWFVSRRIDPRPEDRLDADIAEGAGELGFFSPGSYWPFGLAFGAMIAGLGLAFSEYWLLALGLVGVLFAVGGLLFEYYTSGHTSPTN